MISPEKIAEMLAEPVAPETLLLYLRGCLSRVDDDGMVNVPADYITDSIAHVTELSSSRSELLTLRTERDEAREACPICAIAFKPDDMCLTDIEMGTCHAACLEGSPMVYLDTGEPLPSDAPHPTPYRYEIDWQSRAIAAEAERDRLKSALEYATMGLGRIHDSLLSNGPKQASGEMTAHFLKRARSTLSTENGHAEG